MGIKCSFLGHRFTETEVEEERNEEGSEVVITIEEFEVCERCGERRVVSENTEVRSLASSEGSAGPDGETDATTRTGTHGSSAGEPGPADATGTPGDEGATAETDPTPDVDAAESDAELIDEAEAGDDTDDHDSPGVADTAPADEAATGSPPEGADDGAVILDDDGDERDPGEWPEEAAGSGDDDRARTQGGSTGPDQSTPDWPGESGDAASDEDPATERLTRELDDSDVEPAGTATVTVPEGTFVCTECGFSTDVESSSLRAGDFCPECHRGSLEHRSEDETRKE